MLQTITLTLPDNVLQPMQCVAQATKQSVEELFVTVLQAALPTHEGVPPDVMQHLVALESLDGPALWLVMLQTVPLDQQHRLHDLLLPNQAGVLTESEHEQLPFLQQQADAEAVLVVGSKCSPRPLVSRHGQLDIRLMLP